MPCCWAWNDSTCTCHVQVHPIANMDPISYSHPKPHLDALPHMEPFARDHTFPILEQGLKQEQ